MEQKNKKESFKTILLLIVLVPLFLFMACLTLAELFSPLTFLAEKLWDNWGITRVQAGFVVFGWLFWLIAAILTATSLSKDHHEALSSVLGFTTALLSGILFNIILAESAPILCGIISFIYMGVMLFYRWYQDNKK